MFSAKWNSTLSKTLFVLVVLLLPINQSFAGDPIPGIDVSLEQVPAGKIYKRTTNKEGEVYFKNPKLGKFILKVRGWNPKGKGQTKKLKVIVSFAESLDQKKMKGDFTRGQNPHGVRGVKKNKDQVIYFELDKMEGAKKASAQVLKPSKNSSPIVQVLSPDLTHARVIVQAVVIKEEGVK